MADTVTSIREPWLAKAGRLAVTITAATLAVFRLASRVLTLKCSSIALSDWLVKAELRRLSPDPSSPTTRP